MPQRHTRKTIILAKTETTAGTDSTPTGGANAILVSNCSVRPLVAQNVPRSLIRGFMGGSEHLVGTRYSEATFDVEIAGSGTVATAPAFAPLLLACGFAETVTATLRVDYTPVSTAFSSLTIYYQKDGVQHRLLGARGNVTFRMISGDRPIMSFSFIGLDGGISATANATPTYTAFKVPEVVTEANTADLTFGGTHATGVAPAITGGTAYISNGMEVSLNNAVEHRALLGGESVEITDRDSTCSFSLDLSEANEVAFMAAVKAATLTTVGLIHGTTAGNKVLMWLPNVQRIDPSDSDSNGKLMQQYTGRVIPVVGNDELRLVFF